MATFNIYCEERDFGALAEALCGELEADCPVAAEIVIADKEQIRALNAQFRDRDAVTDVLSFPTLDGILGRELKAAEHPYEIDENGALFLGSVVICEQVAAEQAEEYGHSFDRELYYLAVHGMCHLMGYDHIEESDKRAMREKEEGILLKLNLSVQ